MALNQLIGGSFQDAKGNVLALGSLVFELIQDEALTGSQGQVCSGIKITIPLDSSGNVQGTSSGTQYFVWPTDQMVPSGAVYAVWAYNANGQLVWGPNYSLTVPSSPSPYNLNSWTPNTIG